jgi:hypothetical protein
MWRILAHRSSAVVATCGLACIVYGCSSAGRSADRDQELGPLTATEARAIGCYQLLDAVRDISPKFSLVADADRNTRLGMRGRVIRSRGGYSNARWRSWAGDTLILLWGKSVLADSARTNARRPVVYTDAVTARVTLTGDTLSGRADWRGERLDRFAPQSLSYNFHAKRVNC